MSDFDAHRNFVQVIDGKTSPTENTRHGIDQANLKPHWEVPVATRDDVDHAVYSGQKGFQDLV